MTANDNLRDFFSILHDGTISAWAGDKNMLTLTIDCQYLAERIDESFEKFYLELFNLDKLELTPWTNPVDIPTVIKTDLEDVFKTELEIISADIKDNMVVVKCNQNNTDFDYCGGDLTISCQTIKFCDQHKNDLTIEQFQEICKNYWNEWSKK